MIKIIQLPRTKDTIQYKGNGATSGSEQTDTILQEDVLVHGGYELKDNSNFTRLHLSINNRGRIQRTLLSVISISGCL